MSSPTPPRAPHDHAHDHPHDHGHGHDHGHSHGHGHSHSHAGHHHGDPQRAGRAFAVAIALNLGFVLAEFAAGLMANSTALLADAGHNLSDVLGLALAWGAARLAQRAVSARYSFGLGGSSILAALANGALLLVACGGIGWEALRRFGSPPPVASDLVIGVAAIGLLVNGVSAWLFARDSAHDLNLRGAFLHLLADAAVSLAVVVGGLVMRGTGWYLIDPLLSLLIVAVVLWGTWGLLVEAIELALAGVPRHVDPAAVRAFLLAQPGVSDVHDLHIWALSTTRTALTAHVVTPAGAPDDAELDAWVQALHERFAIHHATLQVERGSTRHHCALAAPH